MCLAIATTVELTNIKKRKEEPVIDYINRLKALSIDCKDDSLNRRP